MINIIGITVSILSLAIALVGAFALADTNEMARMISLVVNEFDNAEWQQHWQVSSIILLASGFTGLISGIGIIKNKIWAFLLLALLLTLLLLGQALMMFSGYAIFAFERINPIEIIIMLTICIFSWYLYGRKIKENST